MNKTTRTLLSLSLLLALALGTTASTMLKTQLRITVLDNLGNIQEGATVTLYGTEANYSASENPAMPPQTTDQKGRVIFKGLEGKPYWINVEKGDLNNFGLGVQTDSLQAGKVNKINIVIE